MPRSRALWENMPAGHPGLQIALDQRAAYYRSRNREIPEFPHGIESRRLIYGIVDLRYGIVRAGGAGRVTKEGPVGGDEAIWREHCCRLTLKRFSDHVYAARRIQQYWLRVQDPTILDPEPPVKDDRYPLALAIARSGLHNWALLPLEWIPLPNPLRVETPGEWERIHGPYAEAWIAFLTLSPP